MNGGNSNLIQYDNKNAENIAVASTIIVITGNTTSIFEDLLFNY